MQPNRREQVTCPPALNDWHCIEPHVEKILDKARTHWVWNVDPAHLYMRQQVNHAGVLGLYVALLLPVPLLPDGPGEPGLKGFPVWHGRGCGPHISILYHAILPHDVTRQWQLFHEIRIRLQRWLLGQTSMLLSDCTAIRLTVAKECQLHTQLRLAREEVLGSMQLVEFSHNNVPDTSPWDDFHITWLHWGLRR